MVPTSRSVAPLTPRMSGMRNPPPISTNCPRDTTTSRPAATARSTTTVAAAQLFTAVAAAAPVMARMPSRTASCRDPRVPVARSSSRLR